MDEPHAGAGQVRIRVSAVAVNPSDLGTRSGATVALRRKVDPNFRVPDPPHVVGWDAVGVVDEAGTGVTDLAIGDRVVAVTNPHSGNGAYVESLVVSAESAVLAPTNVDDTAACTLPMNGLTARLALDKLALPTGATVAVTGGAGTLGGYVVQLAKADGLRVIADAAEADEELVTSFGADVVVRRGPEVARNILEAAPGGVDAVIDNAVQDDAVLAAVRDGGAIVTLRAHTGRTDRGITWYPIHVTEYVGERTRLDQLARQVEAGELMLRVADTYSADRAADAHRRLEDGGVRGRLVITF
ncbi:NADP-dependent oxidoreductase [Pseudonocardia sp. GCM10023141]|uniref:NADP-dependent oxidoreductase n=1 Tax=Pseudonocardia sp. GCM10023141 TaxID=3252653 RepID=UPI00360AA6C6